MKKKLIKKIVIVCIAIILIELVAMLIIKITRERSIDHVDLVNDLIKVSDGYISVGMSDFNDSKTIDKKIYEYTDSTTKKKTNIIANQAKIAKLDQDMNLVWENTIKNKYDSTFYSVLEVSDGFIAVGSLVGKYEQIEVDTRDAIIVKYDLSGNLLWYKTYSVLSDTEFYKVIDDGDGNLVVIGQSIYENMELGNHTTGGGIIVRYDKDGNMLDHNNYGGNKSGSFNDIIKVSDGYLVCGKDALNYGILVKFKKDFNRDEKDTNLISKKVLWQRTYSNTDNIGFTRMILLDKTIYVVGAINVSNEKDDDGNTKFKYDAGIVLYNTSGKYLGKYSIENDTHHRFNSVILSDKELILTGLMDVDNRESKDSLVMKFDLENKKFTDIEKKDYLINKIVELDNKYLIGASQTKCSLYGCEYEPLIKEYK